MGEQKNGDRSSLRPFPCVVGSVCGTAPHVGGFFVAWSWVGARGRSVGDGETQLLTVDPSARASMKNAANCDT